MVRKMSSQLCCTMSLENYNAIDSHMRNEKALLFDAVDLMVSLPLAFKLCPQTLAQRPSSDSPTQAQARTRRAQILPPFHSPSITSVCFSRHKRAVKQIVRPLVGGEEEAFHVEFLKQFECDYANELCLIHATVWTSGVHSDCDNLHSFTPLHVCNGCLWLLNHSTVCESLHLNSSHTPSNLKAFFIALQKNVQMFLSGRTRKLLLRLKAEIQ